MLIVIMVFAMYSLGYDVSTSPHIYKFFLLKVKISIVFIHTFHKWYTGGPPLNGKMGAGKTLNSLRGNLNKNCTTGNCIVKKWKEALRLRNRKYIRDLAQILCITLDIFEFLEPVGPNATAKKHLS